jgi:hypothetical protein
MKPITQKRYELLKEQSEGDGVLLWNAVLKIKVYIYEYRTITGKCENRDYTHLVALGIGGIYDPNHLYEEKPRSIWESILETNNHELIKEALQYREALDSLEIKEKR